jgi:hypothetical protein
MKQVQSIVAGVVAVTVLFSSVTFSVGSCPDKTESPRLETCCDATAPCCDTDCACEINSTPSRTSKEQPASAPVAPRTVELKLAVAAAATALVHLAQRELDFVTARAVSVFIAPHQSLHLLHNVFLL